MSVTGIGSRRRYSMNVVRFARRLDEAGYRPFQIEQALNRQGYFPSKHTVKRWTDPEAVEWDRRRHRRGPVPRLSRCSVASLKLRRIEELDGIGVSCDSITKIVNHEFDCELSFHQVRDILSGRTRHDNLQAVLSGEEARGRPKAAA